MKSCTEILSYIACGTQGLYRIWNVLENTKMDYMGDMKSSLLYIVLLSILYHTDAIKQPIGRFDSAVFHSFKQVGVVDKIELYASAYMCFQPMNCKTNFWRLILEILPMWHVGILLPIANWLQIFTVSFFHEPLEMREWAIKN